VIIESQHTIASCPEIGVASRVAPLISDFEMLCAVDLDDQSRAATDEINDEWPDGILPSEACTIQLMCADAVPNNSLGIR
jgi:hypothetical protein